MSHIFFSSKTQSLTVNLNYETGEHRRADTSDVEQPAQGIGGLLRQSAADSAATAAAGGNVGAGGTGGGAVDSTGVARKCNQLKRNIFPYQVRKGLHKRPAGFQAELVILTPWPDERTPPQKITSVAIFAACNL